MELSNNFVSATKEYSTYEKAVPAPYFRISFNSETDFEDAGIIICGLGFYALFINGKEITKGICAPYISNPDDMLYYDKYDLSKYIKQGENVVGVWLGNGLVNNVSAMRGMDKAPYRSAPKFACSLTVGETKYDAADFKCAPSPLYFDGFHEGNFYDARLEIPHWSEPGFDDGGFNEPLEAELPRGEKKLCTVEPITVSKVYKPVRIFKGTLGKIHNKYTNNPEFKLFEGGVEQSGGYIYDFGTNISGISELRIKGERGQKIRLCYLDKINGTELDRKAVIGFFPDGFAQSDLFICSGGEDVFRQHFTYYSYQYCYVVGITDEQATDGLLIALEANSEIKEIGHFVCSDNDANRLYEMAKRSDITNFHYYLTDCPQREKNGWTGDASTSAEQVLQTFAAEDSLSEWLCNVRKTQTESGALPGIIPTNGCEYERTPGRCYGPPWDSAIFNLPYYIWKYRGETRAIEENAQSMLRYLDFISRKRGENGILDCGIGDWAPVFDKNINTRQAPVSVADTLIGMDICKKAAEMFGFVGMDLNKGYAERLYKELRAAARKALVDTNTMTVLGNCQTSQAMGIYYDLFDEDEKKAAFEILKKIIHEDNDSMSGGFLGLRVIFHVLAECGEADLAYNMICKREFPSYGSLLDKGLTTLPEQFYEDYTNACISMNHHFMGDIINFFNTHVAGLNIISADKVMIKPCFIEKLSFAEAEYTLKSGKNVYSKWKRNGNVIELSFSDGCELQLADGYRIIEQTANGVILKKAVLLD